MKKIERKMNKFVINSNLPHIYFDQGRSEELLSDKRFKTFTTAVESLYEPPDAYTAASCLIFNLVPEVIPEGCKLQLNDPNFCQDELEKLKQWFKQLDSTKEACIKGVAMGYGWVKVLEAYNI